MTDTESKREDKFESLVKKILRKADENRNYVIGGVIALALVGVAIYFKVSSGLREAKKAEASLVQADSIGLLRESWQKYADTEAGPRIAMELAGRLFEEQRDLRTGEDEGKEDGEEAKQNIPEERQALLEEGITLLSEALEKHPGHWYEPAMARMLETFRQEKEWVARYGRKIFAASLPVPKDIDPLAEKKGQAALLEDTPGNRPIVTLKTDRGEILLELFEDEAPNHVANFLSLVLEGFYDGLVWHRVEDWVVQTGCPKGDGTGGPGYRIKAEITDRGHDRGALGMARSTGMDTAGSQIYIVKKPQHDIDGKYTIFGRVLYGMDVVDRLVKGDELLEAAVDRMRDKEYRPTIIRNTADE